MRDASQVLTVECSEVDKITTPFESAPSTVDIPNARYRPLPPANNGKEPSKCSAKSRIIPDLQSTTVSKTSISNVLGFHILFHVSKEIVETLALDHDVLPRYQIGLTRITRSNCLDNFRVLI